MLPASLDRDQLPVVVFVDGQHVAHALVADADPFHPDAGRGAKYVVHVVHVMNVHIEGASATLGLVQQPVLATPGGLGTAPDEVRAQDLSIGALLDHLAGFGVGGPETNAVGDEDRLARLIDGGQDFFAFCGGTHEWLLADDVLVRLQGFEEVLFVQVRGESD